MLARYVRTVIRDRAVTARSVSDTEMTVGTHRAAVQHSRTVADVADVNVRAPRDAAAVLHIGAVTVGRATDKNLFEIDLGAIVRDDA